MRSGSGGEREKPRLNLQTSFKELNRFGIVPIKSLECRSRVRRSVSLPSSVGRCPIKRPLLRSRTSGGDGGWRRVSAKRHQLGMRNLRSRVNCPISVGSFAFKLLPAAVSSSTNQKICKNMTRVDLTRHLQSDESLNTSLGNVPVRPSADSTRLSV